jgi:hypothetical protein
MQISTFLFFSLLSCLICQPRTVPQQFTHTHAIGNYVVSRPGELRVYAVARDPKTKHLSLFSTTTNKELEPTDDNTTAISLTNALARSTIKYTHTIKKSSRYVSNKL